MSLLKSRPLGQKLVIIILGTTAAALAIAGVSNVAANVLLLRDYLDRDLAALARVIARNSTAAVIFNSPEDAATTLAALSERRNINGGCIYLPNSALFAEYVGRSGFKCPSTLSGTEMFELMVHQPIVLEDRAIGTIVLVYDLTELNERTLRFGGTVLAIFVGAILLAFPLATWLRGYISKPIGQLVNAANQVSATGDYGVRAEKHSEDELGLLVDRFNAMLQGIEQREIELRSLLKAVDEERARFHFLAESMPQKILSAGADGRPNYMNRQWSEFLGLRDGDDPTALDWTQIVHPEDYPENARLWWLAIQTGAPFTHQQRFRRFDGQYVWHLSRAEAMRDASGQITMWIASNTDIHEQKINEQELQRANEDLRQFAYSASHDLQEPIRNVSIYSEIVADRYSSVLDRQGKLHLSILKEGGHRLSALVSDLLAYTRATIAELSQHPVDANTVIAQALDALGGLATQTQAEITIAQLPTVRMGALHLQQVFQNLIQNALKYRSAETPQIAVDAHRIGEHWCFSVRDNGIGIDPQYKETIFGVFKRLSNDRAQSGNGIGLAICQRVVERYGGRIWVESESGKGATFYFTVPGPEPGAESATA